MGQAGISTNNGIHENDRLLHQAMARTYLFLLKWVGQIGFAPGHLTINTTMNKPHKHCEIIKAWADGAEIQTKCADGTWVDSEYPCFSPDFQYRIKPRTVKREGWINLYKVNYGVKPGIDVFDTEADARHMALSATIATVKVEWTEEVELCLK